MKGKNEIVKNDIYNTGRKPTMQEINQISKWIYQYNFSNVKIGEIMSVISTIVGSIFIVSAILNTSSLKILFYILGVFCYVTLYLFSSFKKKCLNINREYKNGEFLLVDGIVTKIETNIDIPGYVNIIFLSNDKKINSGWYRVRQENIKFGSPLLLVIPDPKRTKKFFPIVFSDFMLSEEGIKYVNISFNTIA